MAEALPEVLLDSWPLDAIGAIWTKGVQISTVR
jgi:hypothetical protein